jgi:short-subunit dehydrogenase
MVKETDGTLQPAIVVTGASSGIGRDIARLAARDRCFLLLLGRSQQALDQLVAELAAAGSQAAALSIDLLDPRAPDRIESALSERGL